MLLTVESAIKLATFLVLIQTMHKKSTAKLWMMMENVQFARISVTGRSILI